MMHKASHRLSAVKGWLTTVLFIIHLTFINDGYYNVLCIDQTIIYMETLIRNDKHNQVKKSVYHFKYTLNILLFFIS